jgi:hypothetical protein
VPLLDSPLTLQLPLATIEAALEGAEKNTARSISSDSSWRAPRWPTRTSVAQDRLS